MSHGISAPKITRFKVNYGHQDQLVVKTLWRFQTLIGTKESFMLIPPTSKEHSRLCNKIEIWCQGTHSLCRILNWLRGTHWRGQDYRNVIEEDSSRVMRAFEKNAQRLTNTAFEKLRPFQTLRWCTTDWLILYTAPAQKIKIVILRLVSFIFGVDKLGQDHFNNNNIVN